MNNEVEEFGEDLDGFNGGVGGFNGTVQGLNETLDELNNPEDIRQGAGGLVRMMDLSIRPIKVTRENVEAIINMRADDGSFYDSVYVKWDRSELEPSKVRKECNGLLLNYGVEEYRRRVTANIDLALKPFEDVKFLSRGFDDAGFVPIYSLNVQRPELEPHISMVIGRSIYDNACKDTGQTGLNNHTTFSETALAQIGAGLKRLNNYKIHPTA